MSPGLLIRTAPGPPERILLPLSHLPGNHALVALYFIAIRALNEYGRTVSLASCRSHPKICGSLRNQT